MLRVAAAYQLCIVETIYTLDQAKQADEAFITAASIYVMPVGRIDYVQIGDGQTGAITSTLRTAYLETARAEFPSLNSGLS